MHAEPTTFGAKLALWALQADRDRQRLRAARERVAVGKLSGAVGTFSNIDPAVEAHVCRALGLPRCRPPRSSPGTATPSYLWACASVGATIEMIATEIRHLARTEVGEVEEAFGAGQKGSSAMPHKRNPILSERLSGLARVLRGYLGAGLEDVALWHERDICHCSVERVVLPDACLLTYYVLRKATGLVESLVVNAERMLANVVEGSYGLVFCQPVLLALVAVGAPPRRRLPRRPARRRGRSWEQRRPFRSGARRGPRGHPRRPAALDDAFSLTRSLRHRRPVPRRPGRPHSRGGGVSGPLPLVHPGRSASSTTPASDCWSWWPRTGSAPST